MNTSARTRTLLASTLVCVALFTAFVVGARVGAETFAALDAPYRAKLSVLYLQMLERPDAKGLRNSLEADISRHLYDYGNPERVWLGWLLFPELLRIT